MNGRVGRQTADNRAKACFRVKTWGVAALLSVLAAVAGWAAEPPDENFDAHYGKACTSADCHPLRNETFIPMHVPYLEARCAACHEDHRSSETMLLKPGGDRLCLACHDKLEMTTGTHALQHPPEAGACLKCHAPHQSRIRGLVRDESALLRCAQCHEAFLKKEAQKPHRHQYFEFENQCGNCHFDHQNTRNKYLRPEVGETCLTCHDISIRLGTRVIENVALSLRTEPVVHPAIKQGSCPACHTPHGSEQESLLKAGYPAGSYTSYDAAHYALCWRCHAARLVESEDGVGATQFRDGRQNLHRIHVVQLQRGRGCHLCHAAHASEVPHLMRQTVRFGKWDAPLSWQAAPNGGQCMTPCHREKTYDRTKEN